MNEKQTFAQQLLGGTMNKVVFFGSLCLLVFGVLLLVFFPFQGYGENATPISMIITGGVVFFGNLYATWNNKENRKWRV